MRSLIPMVSLLAACSGGDCPPAPRCTPWVAPVLPPQGSYVPPAPSDGPAWWQPDAGGGPYLPRFSTDLCTNGFESDEVLLPRLQLAFSDVDYVEFRAGAYPRARMGWRCLHARDRDACEHALGEQRIPERPVWNDSVFRTEQRSDLPYLLYERRGVLTLATTEAQVLALLGPIDTPAEAVLLAKLRGYELTCQKEHSSLQADGDGWRLTATHAGPEMPNNPIAIVFLDVLHVARDGTLHVQESLRAYQ